MRKDAPRRPLPRRPHPRQLLLRLLTLRPHISFRTHRKDRRQAHQRVFSGVDCSGRVEVLEEEDFECESGDVEPEAVRGANEGRGVEVNGVEDVVLREKREA
jgi:hypothetical protein